MVGTRKASFPACGPAAWQVGNLPKYEGGWPLGPTFTGILDQLGTAAVGAWSVSRRLTVNYEGPLIRLRRSSDNAESDFGADANGDLDTAAIATWIGGGSGFLRTVYDQSGNARDLAQTTAGNQPLYVANGLGSNSRSGFTTTGTLYLANADAGLDDLWATDGFVVHLVYKPTGTITDNTYLLRKSANLFTNWFIWVTSSEARMGRSTTGDSRHKGPDANLVTDTPYVETLNSPVTYNANPTWRRNGSSAALGLQGGVGAGTATDAPYDLQWPASASAHPAQHSELVLFGAEISSDDLQALNDGATSYYGA